MFLLPNATPEYTVYYNIPQHIAFKIRDSVI